MDQVILNMLDQYENITDDDYANSLKQILQQISLLGLWRSKFFEHAAFYGGTALRVLYNINRFSEDLDFSLLKHDLNFIVDPYLQAIQLELDAFGFDTEISIKKKNKDSAIQSAFLKANTQEHLIRIKAPEAIQQRFHRHELIKIKLEVDTDPPLGFNTETLPLLRPIPFWVKSYQLPDLFAGKIAAVLCRQWQLRVKGRDWYDFLWFVQRNTPVRLAHLEVRLRTYGYYLDSKPLSLSQLRKFLINRVNEIDLQRVKDDIIKFVKGPRSLDSWSKDLFIVAINQLNSC